MGSSPRDIQDFMVSEDIFTTPISYNDKHELNQVDASININEYQKYRRPKPQKKF